MSLLERIRGDSGRGVRPTSLALSHCLEKNKNTIYEQLETLFLWQFGQTDENDRHIVSALSSDGLGGQVIGCPLPEELRYLFLISTPGFLKKMNIFSVKIYKIKFRREFLFTRSTAKAVVLEGVLWEEGHSVLFLGLLLTSSQN